ncbi:MAG: primosomal protein N', partial [Halanaerobiaceae bacterium]|nr:primosomal protein N' [Halanaerobiaceae bacterium]
GEASIVIGARSAVFAPVKNPGLIIIDEEHENSYKQGDYPYYHAREVAMKRSKITGATVILGSATPALESYYLARKGVFILSELPDRISQQGLPPVEIVDMREELKKGNTGIFSARLQKLICDALQKKRQAIIFLNRRGYVNFVFCRQCGLAVKCTNCDISLTYHADIKRLSCHYCNWTMKLPETCPECGSVYLGEYGFGTERLEEELGNLFPGAVVERMDIDTVARKASHQKILSRFENGEIDILVGTQMIAKGHDYPNVAVVGVISADTMLNIPDFRSAERAFQLLTQAAGRTGRGEKGGQVIIQTYNPDHYSIKAACKHDYREFYDKEISIRKQFQYPPFTLLVNIIIKGPDEKEVISSSSELYRFLQRYKSLILEILGPAPAGIRKIRKQYRWQIIMKFNGYKKRNFVLSGIREEFLNKFKKDVVFRIDVDPFIMI